VGSRRANTWQLWRHTDDNGVNLHGRLISEHTPGSPVCAGHTLLRREDLLRRSRGNVNDQKPVLPSEEGIVTARPLGTCYIGKK
jgi:hypothetical protein